MLGLYLDDLAQAVAEAGDAGNVEGDQGRKVALHAEAGDHRAGVGIGEGGSVAEKLRDHVKAAGKVDGLGAAVRLRPAGKPFRQREAVGGGEARRLGRCRMERDELVHGGARGRLAPSFSHMPGTMAEKYGAQTPGTMTGRRVVVIVHDEVPKT